MSTIFLHSARYGLGSRAAYWRGQGLDGLASRAAYWRGQGLDGLGLAPVVAASAAVPGVGPFIAAGAGLLSFFGGLFGGRDDQKTNYRPPGNTAEIGVDVGGQIISFDLSDLSTSRRNGNRDDDIFSYYSAFVSGNTSQASDAARKVIENQARQNGVSIREQAARILEYAGVKKIVQSFLPSGQASGGSSPGSLPGYCQPGTYHPYPLGHPRQNECAPFPAAPTSRPGQPGPGQPGPGQIVGAGAAILTTAAARRAAQRAQQERLNQACQTGTYFDSTSQRCLPIPVCGAGMIFDPLTPGCLSPEDMAALDDNEMPSWVWLILIGLGLVIITR
jgi:hypothetical protein